MSNRVPGTVVVSPILTPVRRCARVRIGRPSTSRRTLNPDVGQRRLALRGVGRRTNFDFNARLGHRLGALFVIADAQFTEHRLQFGVGLGLLPETPQSV